MSQENVETIRRAFADYVREGVLPDRGYLAPDVIWNPVDEAPQHGEDAVLTYMSRWEGEWEDLTTEAEEFLDAGDAVVVTVHFRGRGRLSGIEVDARSFQVYTLRDGKITRMDEFNDQASALKAAEATPDDDEHLPLDLPYMLDAYEDDADASPGDGLLGDKMDR